MEEWKKLEFVDSGVVAYMNRIITLIDDRYTKLVSVTLFERRSIVEDGPIDKDVFVRVIYRPSVEQIEVLMILCGTTELSMGILGHS